MNPKMEPEQGITDRPSERDSDPESLLDECRCLLSDIMQEEEVLEKKRRWLMGLPIEDKRSQKMPKTSNFFGNSYIPESYIRNDDVSLENIRVLINSAFKSCTESKISEGFDRDPKKVVIEDPSNSPAQLHDENHFERMNMLSEILIKALNSDETISLFIPELLNHLEVLPSLALISMNRKLKNVTAAPQFAVSFSCKRSFLIKRLKKQCEKILLKMKSGGQLPAPLAKALSIICLAVKAKNRKVDLFIGKCSFFPFSDEVNALQNEVLEAIWAIPGLKPKVWKRLHGLLSPKVDLSLRSFRKFLYNYLMECLFHCDDLQLSGPLSTALEIINQKSQRHLSSVKGVEEELESVLHVSSQLRQIVSESLPDYDADQEYERYAKGLGNKDTSTIKIIDMDCSHFSILDSVKFSLSCSDQFEGSGDSMPDEPNPVINPKEEDSCKLKLDPKNWYQELLNICDDASLIAYEIIGLLLKEFKQQENRNLEGFSSATLLGIIGGLKPSLPESIGERFEKLLRSSS